MVDRAHGGPLPSITEFQQLPHILRQWHAARHPNKHF